MARRGSRRGAAIGVPRRARGGARPAGSARSPVSAGRALLAIAILATAAGMRGYAGFATWARTAPEEVLAQLGIRFRRPSEKTFRAVFSRLDPGGSGPPAGRLLHRAATAADPAGLLAVALDGKTLRGARRAGAAAAHLVSVFAHHARLVLGQLAVAEKSNEIPCVRKILKLLPRQVRLLVTVDAMHTQTATAKLICGTLKSHYLMIVKSNQPKLLARITALPWAEVPVTATDDAHGHGRIERRTLKCSPPREESDSLRQAGHPDHPRTLVSATGERTREVVYAICSLPFEHARPAMIAAWLRDHWGIENSVHWVRDVTFDEDRSTVHTGTAPRSWPACETPLSTCTASTEPTTSPKPAGSPPSAPTAASTSSQTTEITRSQAC